ncbi:metalloreductase STEAP4-like isoform X1 [Centropristis striata]|uniref:metalloreductase STEAP4-like isoform X1 n=1 Tax=Centropristis striata TaxID=184440 RepID=UPI0027DF10BE|nr:metalloreductase STEAP4-like isoform X1 [Centropristis striata]
MNATVANGVSAMMKPESVSLHPLGAAAGPAPEMLCIFGTGDLGRSLGLRLLQSGYSVVYGSRRPNSCGSLPQGAQVMSHAAAAKSASLIFICVHREHYEFLETLAPHLEGKVLVDLSNNLKKDMYPEANAAYLQRLVPGAAVVKGLNTLSAWALQNGLLAGKQVYLCGNSAEAKQAVAEMATKLGLTVLDKGSLSAARELEDFPLQLFPEWRLPLCVALGLTAFFFFYLLIRDVIYAYVEQNKDISYRIMVSLANKVFPIVSLIMLALCYLPGVIAAFLQLYRGTKYRRFPNWLDRWMLCRKQMGIIALGFAFLHAIHTFMTSTRYAVRHKLITLVVDEMKNNKTTPFYFDNTESWGTDSFYALGILGFFLYVLLGLTSLPSVGGSLSWREFSFIQSKLGHLTLFICTAHGYIYGWNKFLRPSTYKWYTPPGYMLCLIVPSVVLVLKALIILPCVDRTLTRIRQGWERNQPREEVGKATNL